MDVSNIVLNITIKLFHAETKSIEYSGEGLSFDVLEMIKYQLIERGYQCRIVDDLKSTMLVVSKL